MRRRLLSFASLLSILLCLVTMVLWVRSFFVSESLAFAKARNAENWDVQRALMFYTCRGGMALEVWSDTTDRFMGMPPYAYGRSPPQYPHSQPGYKLKWGFEWRHFSDPMYADGRPGAYMSSLVLPIWCLVLVFAVLPTISLRKSVVRRRELLRDHCFNCRYDLTGNTSGICPECGTAVKKSN